MDFIISLAHFCEVHGPTSILCTQITPGPCATCHPCATPPSEEPPKSSAAIAIDPLYASTTSVRHGNAVPPLSSPFETPPTSPRSLSSNSYFPTVSFDSGSRRLSGTFDGDSDFCENCTFLVPRKVSERLPDGAPGSPTKDGRGQHGSPVLRTSQSVVARDRSVPRSDSSTSSQSSDAEQSKSAAASVSRSPASAASSTPTSPFQGYGPRNAHTHTITYLTTRQPTSPVAYSLLRRSCIRTLSCEMLPPGSSAGPLYFGDPVAGYTIAYVFRLPDPRARGRLRTYALIALGGRDSWRVMQAYVKVTEVFESIANQIIFMAGKVLDRENHLSDSSNSQSQMFSPASSRRPSAVGPSTPPLSSSASSMPAPSSPSKARPTPQSSSSTPSSRNITPVSSFLSAKKVDPDGYPRGSRDVMRAKGLAEIVGKENFFVELHARFCMLLSGLVKEFGV